MTGENSVGQEGVRKESPRERAQQIIKRIIVELKRAFGIPLNESDLIEKKLTPEQQAALDNLFQAFEEEGVIPKNGEASSQEPETFGQQFEYEDPTLDRLDRLFEKREATLRNSIESPGDALARNAKEQRSADELRQAEGAKRISNSEKPLIPRDVDFVAPTESMMNDMEMSGMRGVVLDPKDVREIPTPTVTPKSWVITKK